MHDQNEARQPVPAADFGPTSAHSPKTAPARDASGGLLFRLLVLLVLVTMVFGSPWLIERARYAWTRAELRARHDDAVEQLTALDEQGQPGGRLETASLRFRLVAQRIEPSVVHISATRFVAAPRQTQSDEWEFFFGPRQRGFQAQGQGSGVIVDPNGYILTNHHVIHGAQDIQVKVSDGRTFEHVEVVGTDALMDLAVLKIDAANLTAAEWGSSNELQVGDWVLAIGNPFGLDRTVTAGIVSAKDRRGVGNSPYQIFLQTDAAVNPGNSGGPLVDLSGRIVGINTAIVGQAFQGISFAIPSDSAAEIYEQLKSGKKVERGWLGVSLQTLTPELVEKLELPDARGALIAHVMSGSPAEKAGLEPLDVVVEFNGQPVENPADLSLAVAGVRPGSTAEIVVLRGGARKTLQVQIGLRPETLGF